MNIQGKLMLSMLIGVLVIATGCGSGNKDSSSSSDDSSSAISSGSSNSSDSTGSSSSIDNIKRPDNSTTSVSSTGHLSLYSIKLGDTNDTIISKLIDVGIATPHPYYEGRHLGRFLNPYKELSDTFGLFVKDKEVIKALQGFVNPKSRELAIAKPSKVRFYYFDEKSDTPFGIHISRYLEPDSMKKEDDLILDNPFYKEICKESGQPDSKEEKIDNLEIGDTRFLAKWITADEELSFSIVSEYFESNSPERFNYEIRLFNLSAMRPHIERAVDIIKAYNENNN